MADRIRLSSIEGGGNWWITLNWAAQAFRNAGFVAGQIAAVYPKHYGVDIHLRAKLL